MATRPNVLFVLTDQHRPDFLGADPEVPVRTPHLDSLRTEGVAFNNAVCPSPLCGPSRACLASGMEYDRCGVRDHTADYPLAAPTFYGRLRDEGGYHVLGTGKFDIQKYSGDHGLDGTNNLAANGFSDGVNCAGKWATMVGADEPTDPYMNELHERGLAEAHVEDFQSRRNDDVPYLAGADAHATFPNSLPDDAYLDNWIGDRTVELLRAAPADRPWFLQVNFAGPHNPWDVSEEMHDWYRDPDVTFPEPVDPGSRLSAETHQEVRRNYAAMIENVDRWVGRFLDVVDDRGEAGETVVVFAADHGEMLGDHGLWYKNVPYQPSIGVPLIVAGPDVERRGAVDAPATILDVHATALDYAGIDPGPVDSRSMRPYLEGDGDPREVVFSGLDHWRVAFDGRHKLVRGFDPARSPVERKGEDDPWKEAAVKYALRDRAPLLFDVQQDPDETAPVTADRPDVRERLDEALVASRTR